jgi:Flp pilus assembly pilin Flp
MSLRSFKPNRSAVRKKSSGQSMVEYLLLAALAVALIAVPVQGKRSAVELMLDSVQIAYTKFLTALSLPQ